jgi:hypothetical protein
MMEKRVASAMPRMYSARSEEPLFYNWLLAARVVTEVGYLKQKLGVYMFKGECPFIPGKVGLLA